MAKYNPRNHKKGSEKKVVSGSAKGPSKPVSTGSGNKPVNKKLIWITAVIVAFLGSLIYMNTSTHDFNLDDFSVIVDNKMTKEGSSAITKIFKSGYRAGMYLTEDNLYRPLTKAMFAVEYEKTEGKPGLSHWINIILYGLLCGFIFLSLNRFFPGQYYLALIATLLFTFHPVHTEVVANIKSRDELLSMFFIMISLWFAKSYADSGKLYWIIPSAAFYFASLFTKESAITYVALLPVTLHFVSKISLSKNAIITCCMIVITGIYLYIHQSVIGFIGLKQIAVPDNSIVASKDFMVQRMTAIEILGRYLKVFLFPHPLSCDYSFNTIPLVTSPANGGFLLSLIIHVTGLVFAIKGFMKKKVYAYAILFYFITISVVSNVFMLIGTNMAERLLFLPSLGLCLLAAYGLVSVLKIQSIHPVNIQQVLTKKPLVWALLIPILVLYSFKTIDRNKDWKNVSTLFNADLKTVPKSVHMLYYHANMITNKDSLAIKTEEERQRTLELAEKELNQALTIYEPFPEVHSLLGKINQKQGDYQTALKNYERRLKLNANDPVVFNNYGTCFGFLGQLKEAEVNFKKAVEISPVCYADALCNLSAVYISFAGESIKANKPDEAREYFNKSIEMANKTIECEKEYPLAYQYLGVVYQNLGDTAKANAYYKQYQIFQKKKDDKLLQKK